MCLFDLTKFRFGIEFDEVERESQPFRDRAQRRNCSCSPYDRGDSREDVGDLLRLQADIRRNTEVQQVYDAGGASTAPSAAIRVNNSDWP